jgi:hypothetical protein
VRSLLTGALCIREHHADLKVISALLSLAEKTVGLAQQLVKTMPHEHRKLKRGRSGPSITPTWKKGQF